MTTFNQLRYTNLIQEYKTKKSSHLKKMHPDLYSYLIDTTPFLPNNCTTTQRLWHHHNNVWLIPTCQHCDNLVKWDTKHQQYRSFCSTKCSTIMNGMNRKVHDNNPKCIMCDNFVSWNSTTMGWNNTCSQECNQQYQRTLIIDDNELFKLIDTIPDDYDYRKFVSEYRGAFNVIQNKTQHLPNSYHLKQRIEWLIGERITKQEKLNELKLNLGGSLDMSVKQARSFSKLTNKNCIWCNTQPRKYNEVSSKYSLYCSDECKHNHSNHKLDIKLAQQQLKETRQQNLLDAGIISNIDQQCPHNFNANEYLNDGDWLYNVHYIQKWTKQRIATFCGVDKETITNRFKRFNIEAIRHSSSGQESELAEFLSDHYSGQIITNDRNVIAPLELDIYIPDYKLAIEYCGLYWHSDIHDRIDRNYHKNKLGKCNEKGIRLITIFEDEWINKQEIVKQKLLNILNMGISEKIYARNCTITSVSLHQKKVFFDQNHIQGSGPGSINIGLKYNNELVACMSFIKQTDGVFVLNRYATSKQVTGGFCKLLSYFKKIYEWKQIISFADLRWSEGNVYEQNGFMLDKILVPDYQYIRGKIRIHKFNYRHNSLKKKLVVYDSSLSEAQNTKNNGILRIWDCGKLRYVLSNEY